MEKPKSQIQPTGPQTQNKSDALRRENGVFVYSSSLKISDPKTGQVLVQMRCS